MKHPKTTDSGGLSQNDSASPGHDEPKRLGPISLAPLKPQQALAAILAVKPQPKVEKT